MQHIAASQAGTTVEPLDLPIRLLQALDRQDRRGLASLLLREHQQLAGLAETLVRERLAVQVYAALQPMNLAGLFPRASWRLLEDQWQRQQVRNDLLCSALERIDHDFAAAAIPYRALKGLPLAETLYGGSDRRFSWDIDLLVRRQDLHKALDLLAEAGFLRPWGLLGMERFAPVATHAIELRRVDGLCLDLHWDFRRLPGLRLDLAALWRESRPFRLRDLTVMVPGEEHTLLQLLLGIAADVDRGLCRLRSLWDASILLKRLDAQDLAGFLERRQAEGASLLVLNAMAIVVHGLHAQADFPAVIEALAAQHTVTSIQGTEQSRRLLGAGFHQLNNHLLYADWQPVSRRRYWSWWAATWPLRFWLARRL